MPDSSSAIWQTSDRSGRTVSLTPAGWTHIVDGHGEMAGREVRVLAAVERPDLVTRDADYPRRECHYRRVSPRRYLRVVVNYRPVPPDEWAGEVVTAHYRQDVKRGEHPLWP